MARSEMLVGGDRNLKKLRRAFFRARQGNLQVVSIRGYAGSGKSALVRRFIRQVVGSGGVVLSAVGSEIERSADLGIISQLLRGECICDRHSREIDHLHSGLVLTHPPQPLVSRTVRLLSEVLMHLAAQTAAVVVVVDDAHQADDVSLECLSLVSQRLWRLPLVMVFTECAGEDNAPLHVRSAILASPNIVHLRCRALSARAVAEFVDTHLGQDSSGSLATEWHRITGGNPLLLHALLQDARRAAAPGQRTATEATFTAAVLMMLTRSGSGVRELAQALAVLGESIQPGVLAAVVGCDHLVLARLRRVLHESGLFVNGRFRHPMVKSAVEAGTSHARCGRLHHRAASALHDQGHDPARVADHLVRAAESGVLADGGADGWEVQTLLDTAHRARSQRRFDDAIRYCSAALSVCTDARGRAALLAVRVSWEWERSSAAVGRDVAQLRVAAKNGLLTARMGRAVVKELFRHSQVAEGIRVLEGLFCSQGDSEDVAALSRWVSVTVPGALVALEHAVPEPPRLSSLSMTFHDVKDLDGLAGNLLHGVLTGSLDADEAHVVAEYVLRECLLSEQSPDVSEMALYALIYLDKAGAAIVWCDRLLENAATRGLPTQRSILASVRGMASLRQGYLRQALDFGRRALIDLDGSGWGMLSGPALCSVIAASVALGEPRQVESLLTRRIARDAPADRWELHYLHARGQFLRAMGDLTAALGDFRASGELMRSWRMDVASLVPWRLEMARTHLLAGRLGRARDAVEEQLAVLRPGASRVRGMALRTLAALERPRDRCDLLVKAVDHLEVSGDHLESAGALAELSYAHAARDELGRARRTARRAEEATARCLETARFLETETCRPPVLALPAQLPKQGNSARPARTVLSEAEHRVAVLAARGSTNREIAQELFITRSTVEQHLTRVYRKLSVRERSELPGRLRVLDPSANEQVIS